MLNLRQLAKDRWLTQMDICEILGVTQSKVSILMNHPERIRPEIMEKLKAHFGEEVINSYMIPDKRYEGVQQSATVSILTPEAVEEIKQEVRDEAAIPMVSNAILSQRTIDVYKYIQVNGSELSSIDPRALVDGAEFAMEILKDSMVPDFAIGDIVFLQFLPETAKLHSGGVYFIDTPAYAGMIRDVFIEGSKITLRPRNPKYSDIVFDAEVDTYRAANIIGFFRRNFNSSFSYLQRIYDQKDAQIHRMIEVVERQAEQQSKLIDLLTKE